MTNLNTILHTLFAASDPAVMVRNSFAATLPIAFLDDVYAAHDQTEVLAVYAEWTKRLIGSENCTISLLDDEGKLVVRSLSGLDTTLDGTRRNIDDSATGAVYKRRKALFIPDLSLISTPSARIAHENGFIGAFIAPVRSGARCFGTLTASFRVKSERPELVMTLIEAMAKCLGAQMMLFDQLALLEGLAQTDPLTGARNRRAFNEVAPKSWRDWAENHVSFAILTLDIDRFKSINDAYGHAVGDDILVQLANRIMGNCRSGDMVFRMGGEEFGVLLPTTGFEQSMKVASRIHRAIRDKPFVVGDRILTVTVSIGVTESRQFDTSASDVMNRADQALYQAKHDGRDRVVRASDGRRAVA